MFRNSCRVLVRSSLCGRWWRRRRFSSHSLCAYLRVAGFHSTIRRSKLPLWPEQKGRSSVTNRLPILRKSSPWQMSPSHSLQRLQLPAERKKVKQLRAAFYPANHQMNLHAPLLGCSSVRSAGLYCNVNPMNPNVFSFFGRLVVFWDEGKTVQEVWMHSYPL